MWCTLYTLCVMEREINVSSSSENKLIFGICFRLCLFNCLFILFNSMEQSITKYNSNYTLFCLSWLYGQLKQYVQNTEFYSLFLLYI